MSNKGGQPTKYKSAYCNEVKEHLAQGLTLASWAGTVGVCRATAYNWADAHEEFLDAIKVGKAKGQLVWEKKLLKQADDGEGNTAAIIFGMKNLYRDDWADKIINEHSGPDGKAIEIDHKHSARERIASRITELSDRNGTDEDTQ